MDTALNPWVVASASYACASLAALSYTHTPSPAPKRSSLLPFSNNSACRGKQILPNESFQVWYTDTKQSMGCHPDPSLRAVSGKFQDLYRRHRIPAVSLTKHTYPDQTNKIQWQSRLFSIKHHRSHSRRAISPPSQDLRRQRQNGQDRSLRIRSRHLHFHGLCLCLYPSLDLYRSRISWKSDGCRS